MSCRDQPARGSFGGDIAYNNRLPKHSRRRLEGLQEDEEASASVEIDDIIGSYDLPSLQSTSTSFHSFLSSVRQLSQTFFSARSANHRGVDDGDDDTISFRSALQDGFSLSQYNLSYARARSRRSRSGDFIWSNADSVERQSMLKNNDFELLWHNINYKIKQKFTLGSLLGAVEQSISQKTSHLRSALFHRNNEYRINNDSATHLCDRQPISILRDIDGSFKSSQLTAIIGPSGAGKTSLLNFLARRREVGYTGEYRVHGSDNQVKISTIPQDDRLPSYLTVRENLMFASRMKNPNQNCDHEAFIERVAVLLGLVECLDTRTVKISGGQCKRLAIAQELLSRPDILILDEPTSGLDSSTCYKTVSALKDLVKASARKTIDPMAILITIHQPEQEVFDLFDKIYVMAMGGRVIYDGPPESCLEFIERHTGIKMPTSDYNPASFLIEIASGEYGEEPIQILSEKVSQVFRDTSLAKMQKKILAKGVSLNPKGNVKKDLTNLSHNDEECAESENANLCQYLDIDNLIPRGLAIQRGQFWLKTCHLLKRSAQSICRDPKQLFGSIIFHIILPISIALISGTVPGRANACPNISSELKMKDMVGAGNLIDDGIQEELISSVENVAQNFVIVFALCTSNIAFAALSFAMDMQTSLKEFNNGWYSMSSYILSRILVVLPLEIFLPFMTYTLYWYMTGQAAGGDLNAHHRMAIAASGAILGAMIGQTIGMIFGAIYMKHITTALFLSQAVCLPLCFFSGFVVRTKTMSSAVLTLSYASFYRHVMEISALARYGFNICECNSNSPTTDNVTIIGLPDGLKSFGEFFFAQMESNKDSIQDHSNSTDIFQTFAKQISLYNSYGVEIHSCQDVRPYQLYEYSLDDRAILRPFISLILILVIMNFFMYATVRIVLKN